LPPNFKQEKIKQDDMGFIDQLGELETVIDVLERVHVNLKQLPEQLKMLDCSELDHSKHIRPIVASVYVLSSVIDDISGLMISALKAEKAMPL